MQKTPGIKSILPCHAWVIVWEKRKKAWRVVSKAGRLAHGRDPGQFQREQDWPYF